MNMTGTRLLVVEDVMAAALYMQMGFKSYGLLCDVAYCNAQAFRHIHRALRSGFSYHLVIVDMNLPDGMGTDLIKWILSLSTASSAPKIMATSGDVPSDDVAQWLARHQIDFLPKSADLNQWMEIITQIRCDKKDGADGAQGQPAGHMTAEMKALHAQFQHHLTQTTQSVKEATTISQLRVLLHQLIGSCTLYGLLDLAEGLKKNAQDLRQGHIPFSLLKQQVLQCLS